MEYKGMRGMKLRQYLRDHPEEREQAEAALSSGTLIRSASNDEKKTNEERKAILEQSIQSALARGARLEVLLDFYVLLVEGKPINHILHLLLSVFTFGLWLIVWLVMAVSGGEKRFALSVDDSGNVRSLPVARWFGNGCWSRISSATKDKT